MPVSRQVAEQLAQQVTDLYRAAEQRMLERIASNLRKGLDDPAWAQQKLAQMRAYRRQTQALIKDLEAEARTGVQTALTEAYDRGGLAAVQDAQRIAAQSERVALQAQSHTLQDVLEGKYKVGMEGRGGKDIAEARARGLFVKGQVFAKDEKSARPLLDYLANGGEYGTPEMSRLLGYTPEQIARYKDFLATQTVEPLAGLKAIERLVEETLGYLNATGPRILGSTMQAYKGAVEAGHTAELEQSIAEGIAQVRLGAATRIQGSQTVLDNFAKHGITGLVDKAGRGWDLSTYAEMAVRAGTTNAAVAGHLDTLLANDLPLVIVSEDGAPCPSCVDWEGQILSIEPGNPEYDSVEDAMGAGLFHPGCKHDVSAYQEGYTRMYPEKSAEEIDAEAQLYLDNQKLRGIEREIRKSKRMEAVALDDNAKAAAHARVLRYQAQAREHVASTGSIRQYARESITRSGGRGVAAAAETGAAGGAGGGAVAEAFAAQREALGGALDALAPATREGAAIEATMAQTDALQAALKSAREAGIPAEQRAAAVAEKIKHFDTAAAERRYILDSPRGVGVVPSAANPYRAAWMRDAAEEHGLGAVELRAYEKQVDLFTTSVDMAPGIRQAAVEVAGRTAAQEFTGTAAVRFAERADPALVALFRSDQTLSQAYARQVLSGGKDTLVLYRGVVAKDALQGEALAGGVGSSLEMGVNALSSWSTREEAARSFAVDAFGTARATNGMPGGVVRIEIPISDVGLCGDITTVFRDVYGGVEGYEVMPVFRDTVIHPNITWLGKVGDKVKDIRELR